MNLDDDDAASETLSCAASLFSVASLVSSASNLSVHSGYTPTQIATATKELFDIFHRDSDLDNLYYRAIHNPEIGSERLQRNLRRLFQAYAKNLEDEHTENLEYLASKLVTMKARVLARSIAEKYDQAPVEKQVDIHRTADESSEDETQSQLVDEEIFEDLKAFRRFFTGAEAFRTFRAQFLSFAVPRPQQDRLGSLPQKSFVAKMRSRTWQVWCSELVQAVDALLRNRDLRLAGKLTLHLVYDAFALATDRQFVALGLLEPPLSPGMCRMRWKCVRIWPRLSCSH